MGWPLAGEAGRAEERQAPASKEILADLYKGALCGPCMVDGMEGGKPESPDTEDMAGVAPENRVHVARLRNMSLEELDEIGRKADEERERQERFAEIP